MKEKILFQVNQLQKKFQKKKNDSEEVEADDETQADIKKPANKNKLIIQGVIVLALVYFVAEEFMKEEAVPPTPQLKARPDQIPNDARPGPTEETPSEETPIEEAPPEETPSLDSSETDSSQAGESKATDETPPESSLGETDFNTTPETDQGLSEALPPEGMSPDTDTDDFSSTPAIEETPPAVSDESTPSDFDSGMGQGQGNMFDDLASPIEDTPGDLTEKILQDLESQTKAAEGQIPTEYVAPPDYEYQGRGLVYNCKALHWACVDGPSYKTCEQNAAYLKENAKTPECYPFNIYETSRGCTAMQNRMVSSGANTDFCQGF